MSTENKEQQIVFTDEDKKKVYDYIKQGNDIGFAMDLLSCIRNTEFDDETPENTGPGGEFEDWRANCLGITIF